MTTPTPADAAPASATPATPATPQRTPARELLLNAALVFLGGAVGVGARQLTGVLVTGDASSPGLWTLIWINVVGSFALGIIASWAARGEGRDRIRLLLGTGVCGGFTTYSGIAAFTGQAIAATNMQYQFIALLLGSGTAILQVGLGVLAAWLGWRIGSGPVAARERAK